MSRIYNKNDREYVKNPGQIMYFIVIQNTIVYLYTHTIDPFEDHFVEYFPLLLTFYWGPGG